MLYAKRDEVLADTPSYSQELVNIACRNKGREYNRAVARLIMNELLDDKLSGDAATEFLGYANVVVFMDEGMFASTAGYLETLVVSDALADVKTWLVETLRKADSV